jgi:ABC-type sugar transport system substrate-binding protein
VLGVWDNTDIGTAAAIKEAGMTGKVFVTTSGGGGQVSCKGLQDGSWDFYVSYDVPGQARDLTDLVSAALQDKEKLGTNKIVLYTPLVTYTRNNVMKQSCWTLDDIR